MASQGTSSRRSRRTKCNSIYRRDSAQTNCANENKLDRASPPLSFGSIDQITKTLSGLNITDKPVNSQETEPNQQAAQTPTPSICHELQETETNIINSPCKFPPYTPTNSSTCTPICAHETSDSNSATDHTPNRRNSWSVYTPRQSCVLSPSYRCDVCKVEFRNLFKRNHHEHECRRSKLLSSSPGLDSSSSPELPLPIDIVHEDSNILDIQDDNSSLSPEHQQHEENIIQTFMDDLIAKIQTSPTQNGSSDSPIQEEKSASTSTSAQDQQSASSQNQTVDNASQAGIQQYTSTLPIDPLQCQKCLKKYKYKKSCEKHMSTCSYSCNFQNNPSSPSAEIESPTTASGDDTANNINADRPSHADFMFGQKTGIEFSKEVTDAYNKIVCYRQNLFKVPSGQAGKNFLREFTRLMSAWNSKSALADIAWTCIMTMPALLLQKPSKDSKAKDHQTALKRRLELWLLGDIKSLLDESDTIQRRLRSSAPVNSVEAISKKFATLMKQGKLSAAVKLLTSNMEGGILPLNEETMQLLRSKHPEPTPCNSDALFDEHAPEVHPVVFESITADSVRKAALKTRGGAGPSGIDADGWRHILASRNFGNASEELRSEFAKTIKILCTEKVEHISTPSNTVTSNIEALLACRLIPLDKCPGLRPIGVGEPLRRVAGRVVMGVVKEDVQKPAGAVQVCAGQPGGCEAAIHGMRSIWEDEDTDAVLLIDAANAFNSINREAMLENVSRICPIAYIYAYNCYSVHARLFVLGGAELKSKEGTTQGDPTSMALYAIGSLPFLWLLDQEETGTCQVAYADDLSGGGKIEGLRKWFNVITDKGPLFGYHAEPTKSWLIVKEDKHDEAKATFEGTGVNITVHGKKQLGAAIGKPEFKKDFVSKLVEKWVHQIKVLSDLAKFEPHAAYTAFTSCIRHRYTFYMRTIPNIESLLQPLEDAINSLLIPALTEGRHHTADERALLSLPPRLGGMGIINPTRICQQEFEFSMMATNQLATAIKERTDLPTEFNSECRTRRSEIRTHRREGQQQSLDDLRSRMTPSQIRTNDMNCEIGASNWLTALPIEKSGFHLTKREFWDSVLMRYEWPLPRLPSRCVCKDQFNVNHAMTCQNGGFLIHRHNEIRDLTSDLLEEVCHDVCVEPPLVELTGEEMDHRTANTSPEARLDISARGVWARNQRAFFDVRVFSPNARRFQNQTLKKAYIANEKEKKRSYGQRIQEVEHGTFTPLVFSVHGGMGEECKMFYKRLSSLLSEKRNEDLSSVTAWVRTKIRFALLRSALVCVRGTRHRYYKPNLKDVDMDLEMRDSAIREE